MAGSIAMAASRKGVRITDMPLFKLLGYVIAALYCPKERGVALLESVAIFVDVQNIYYTTRQCFSRHFNYGKFWTEITRDRQVVKAIAFAIDRDDEKQRLFQNILRSIGFEVKLKPF